jgi:zinc protease
MVLFQLTFFLNRILTRDEQQTLNTLTHILVGTFHSRILGEARKRGICYGMGSHYTTSPMGVSELLLSGQVSPENAQELFELMIEQLNAVRAEGVTDQELEDAKQYQLGSLQMAHETVSSLVDWYDEEYYEMGTIDRLDTLPARINKTTRDDIQAILAEFLDTDTWTLGGIGNVDTEVFHAQHELFKKNLTRKTVQ